MSAFTWRKHSGFHNHISNWQYWYYCKFVFPYICTKGCQGITFQGCRLAWYSSFLVEQLKQSWQNWHSCAVESLWKTLLTSFGTTCHAQTNYTPHNKSNVEPRDHWNYTVTRKRSSRMHAKYTNRAVTRPSSEPVSMRPIVDRQTPMKTLPSLAAGKNVSSCSFKVCLYVMCFLARIRYYHC